MSLSTCAFGVCVCLSAAAAEPAGAPAVDLMADLPAWESWAHRPQVAPRFEREPAAGLGDGPALTIQAGAESACGCWRRVLPPLAKGHRYVIEAAFQAEGVSYPNRTVWALLTRGGREFLELQHLRSEGGWQRMRLEFTPDEDLADLRLSLFLVWTPRCRVRWSGVRLTDVTSMPRQPRTARLAAISGKPKAPASQGECIDFYCRRLDEVGRQGADLVCLPEVINTDGLEESAPGALAEPIPGPSTERLAAKARQYHMYVAASLCEREGTRLYNTGVLIDREGRIAGKYRKTHLSIGESLLSGKTPGDDYPVFDTDFGRVGYLICFDYHYPEVARALAVEGADVLLLSNMGDAREGGTLWEPCIRTRAIDNQVHIVASVNSGRSCIISPRGEVLSMVDKTPGAVASATCDLDLSVRNYSGRPIGKRYLQSRRADTFGVLQHEYQGRPEGE